MRRLLTLLSSAAIIVGSGVAVAPAANLFQHLDASVGSSIISSGGAVTAWNDLSGNGRNAIVDATSDGIVRVAPTNFVTGLTGLDLDTGGDLSNSSFPEGSGSLPVAIDLLSGADTHTWLNGANGFAAILVVDPDGPDDGLTNATGDWTDMFGTAGSSWVNGPGRFGIRQAGLNGPTGSDGKIQAYINTQDNDAARAFRTTQGGTPEIPATYMDGTSFTVGLNFDRSTGTASLYSPMNGLFAQFNVPTTRTVGGEEVDSVFGDSNQPLRFGSMDNDGDIGGSNRFFDGQVGEIKLWDGSLGNEEFIAQVDALHEKWTINPDGQLYLQVDRATGAVELQSPGSLDIDLIGLSITSPSGSLNPAGWTSVTDNHDSDSGGGGAWDDQNTWLEFSSTEYELTEATEPTGTTTYVPAKSPLSLGNAYKVGGQEDLFAAYYVDGSEDPIKILIDYIGDAPAGLTGDYNEDGVVDAADYTVWRDALGDAATLPNTDPGDTDGMVTSAEYDAWVANFGASAAPTAAESTPEPGALALLLGGIASLLCGRRRIAGLTPAYAATGACVLAVGVATSAVADVTVDREYLLGDNGVYDDETSENEGAADGIAVGSGNLFGDTIDWAGRPGSGNIITLLPGSSGGALPEYESVGSRPLSAGSAFGVRFNGNNYLANQFTDPNADGNQTLTLQGGLGKPSQGPNGAGETFPNVVNTRGIQLWVNPDNASTGSVQDIINDTYQFGVQISAAGNWAHTWGLVDQPTDVTGHFFESATPVAAGQWAHVMHHSANQELGILYVNGVAVDARGVAADEHYYNVPAADGVTIPAHVRNLTVGASIDLTPTFSGVVDDIEIYVAEGVAGEWGDFFLGADNEFIADAMSGIPDGDTPDQFGNYDGVVNMTDVNYFISHYGETQLLNGNVVGDLVSRETMADFNYDGRTDFRDWILLRSNYTGAAALDLGVLLAAPEPSAALLVLAGLGGLAGVGRRR